MKTVVFRSVRFCAATATCVILTLGNPQYGIAGGEWPEGPYKEWFENLKRPDVEHKKLFDEKSRSCCGVGDVVKTKFLVEPAGGKHPDDRWYAWLTEKWVMVPPEKIIKDYAPDGQAYLFVSPGDNTIMCFVRPRGAL
jgi:hypothetical protein